jgi:Uma2 family endonuclease
MSVALQPTLTLDEFLALPETKPATEFGWLIDPGGEQVMVFSSEDIPHVVPRDGALEGGEVLPGFRCPVREIFAWLREQG